MGDWYKDKKQTTYVGTYANQKDMQKDVKEASQQGWIVKETTTTAGHVKRGIFGAKNEKSTTTLTFVRAGSDPAAAAEALTQYAALRDSGAISDKEFNELKKKLLGK